MKVLYRTVTICGSPLLLVMLCVLLLSRWLRKQSKQVNDASQTSRFPDVKAKMGDNPNLSADLYRAQQLESHRKQDPQATIPLI